MNTCEPLSFSWDLEAQERPNSTSNYLFFTEEILIARHLMLINFLKIHFCSMFILVE